MEPHEKERETKRTKKTKSVRIFGHDLVPERRRSTIKKTRRHHLYLPPREEEVEGGEGVETMVVDPRGGKYSMGLKKWDSLSKVVLCFALNVKRQVQ
ncbi:hypothetical protein AAG906_025875 [Vitis piasezkii]